MSQTYRVSGVLIATLWAFALACCILLFINRDFETENNDLKDTNSALLQINYKLQQAVDSLRQVCSIDSVMVR